MLDPLPAPSWVVREDAHIEFANAAARGLAQSGMWVREHAGRVQTMGDLDAEALLKLVCEVAASAGRGTRLLATSARLNGQLRRGMLHVVPIADAAAYTSVWPRARALLMLQVQSAKEHDDLWLAHIAERFKLTRAQRLILESLREGFSVEAIAESRGIKPGTVRAHLHELLSKTGQTRQSDLVSLALGR